VHICFAQIIKPTILKLKEFTFELVDFASYDKKELGLTSSPNTEVFADLSETLDSAVIKISSDLIIKIELEQKVETSVTIMDEEPHCDLVDLKHYESKWQKLKEEKILIFRGVSYTNTEVSKFPKIEMKELLNEANKHCGQRWADLAKSAKSPDHYPCAVTVSRFFVKVKGVNKLTRQKFERIITVKMPMGC
jgi:hypothetical protein